MGEAVQVQVGVRKEAGKASYSYKGELLTLRCF